MITFYHRAECQKCQQQINVEWNASLPSHILKQPKKCVEKELHECNVPSADALKREYELSKVSINEIEHEDESAANQKFGFWTQMSECEA